MINLLIKLLLSSVIIIACDAISPYSIQFGAMYEAIILGVFIGLINYAIEWLLFARGTFWITTILDFVITLCVLFFGVMIFDDAYIGTSGAVVTAILITIVEFILHSWLLKKNWQTKLIAKNNH
ncbi:uncharacterized membrane protein YvlD (DUF360 family) [Pullulanibacillus pueri]|uniref:DUF2512 family protein n=1 Tax=Pullulanibacillus pueri TaxID=1437324 RepID=A0A8J3A1T4_9BACL|nr:DUF2512 family protein [Pullulanibacillus pueri]MBM7680551.1 uncharacterized membrane protein YvlD (DUF360 family) [Pullulanibacillus pueri]GGH88404.1 hypothetical protein GCM10007096_40660 [Pullulanibacillus pueri]